MSPELLGWLASIAFISRLLPQPVRLARTGLPEGVSPVAAMNAVISDAAWLAYGVQVGLAPVWVVAMVALLPSLWTVVLLRRQIAGGDLARSGAWLAAVLVAGLTGTLGIILGASVLLNIGPQVWTAIRQTDLRGLSVFTWLLAIADGLLWGAYGVAVGDGALLAYSAILVAGALVVLARLARTGSLALARPPSPPEPALEGA